MNDLISRRAAVEAMLELQKEDDDAYGCHIPEAFHGERAAKALKSLPSAQPEHSEGLYVDGYNDGYRDGMKDAQPNIEEDEDIPIEYFENGGI